MQQHTTYLVERVQQFRNQRGPGRRNCECVPETEVVKIADEAVGRYAAECQGVPPEIPLEYDDTEGHHTHPDQGQCRLSSRQPGVEEGDAGDHDQDHTGCDEDERLVT